MKKILYTIFLLLVASLNHTFASTNLDLFTDNSDQFEEVFAPVEQLATVLADYPEADFDFVQTNFATIANSVSLMNQLIETSRPMEDRPALGISGYIWGACLFGVGILLVYILLDDASKEFRKKETIHALIGCAGSAVLWVLISVIATGSFLYGV